MPLHGERQHELRLTDDTQRFHTSWRRSQRMIKVMEVRGKNASGWAYATVKEERKGYLCAGRIVVL